MSISRLFQQLGAPLANTRWSWGAVRPVDGAVFLRVWQDLKFVESGLMHAEVDSDRAPSVSTKPGHQERRRHIELIRSGARCYLVMCTAVDTHASPRKIEFFNDDDVFVGGDIVERSGVTYVKIVGRRPVSAVAAEGSPLALRR
jgi:hypothetical protein